MAALSLSIPAPQPHAVPRGSARPRRCHHTSRWRTIDLGQGIVQNPDTEANVRIIPSSPIMLALVEEGGLIPFLKSGRRDRVSE